ncbi:MAG: MBL fold metallo-hydrolase [Verrucomicrobia bacterium]|nr:MBL fold metallo-hydrolase [Verrucomicrobiota bacterium]
MIHVFDTRHLGRRGIIAVTAAETNEGLVLFDAGPESTFDNVSAELRASGFATADVRHVFLSHIHFDHAGAAWRFAELGATIYVHPRGAPHLLDPEKLVNSARRIFGEDMERLWGRVAPVPHERLKILQDGDVVRLGTLEVRAIETPGHASHHHIYEWEENVFGGDVAGVRIGNGPPVPPFVPPELNVEWWRESIAKIRALQPRRLYLPHFGVVGAGVSEHLAALDERVARWSEWFRDQLRAGADEASLRGGFAELEQGELRGSGASEAEVLAYEQADPSYMAVAAAERYWRKYHPEEVGG